MKLFGKKEDKNIENLQQVHINLSEPKENYNWVSEEKTISYSELYQNGMDLAIANEFKMNLDKATLSSLIYTQGSVAKAVSLISKQFLNTQFVIEKDDKTISSSPELDLLNNPKSQPASIFYSNLVMDLIYTGEAFIVAQNKTLIRIPSVNVSIDVKSIEDVKYRITMPDRTQKILNKDEIIHIMLPNPQEYGKGLSPLVSASSAMLNDKYSREFITAYFVRGGSAEMILGTKEKSSDGLVRQIKSLMQNLGGRSNLRQHKVLPESMELIAQGETLGQSQMVDKLKEFERDVISYLGVPPSLVGQTDGVNYANSVEQMKTFWKTTILPIQTLICDCIKSSNLFKDKNITLKFDNANNEYLSDYANKLNEDKMLAQIATVNERRAIIGLPPIEGGDEIAGSQPTAMVDMFKIFNQMQTKALKKKINPKRAAVPVSIRAVYKAEFKAWESVILDNINDKDKALNIIANRNETFALKMTRVTKPYVLKVYNSSMRKVAKKSFSIVQKDATEDKRRRTLEQLAQRADSILGGLIATRSRDYFDGYSENMTLRVYAMIDELLKVDTPLNEISRAINEKFGEFYKGQSQTIMRTEFLSSQSLAFGQFEDDINSVADVLEKEWVSFDDDRTRDVHAFLNGEVVRYRSGEEAKFSNGLRYPREEGADASEVINCRCSVVHRIVSWKD
jgi:phage portal protein BeeE